MCKRSPGAGALDVDADVDVEDEAESDPELLSDDLQFSITQQHGHVNAIWETTSTHDHQMCLIEVFITQVCLWDDSSYSSQSHDDDDDDDVCSSFLSSSLSSFLLYSTQTENTASSQASKATSKENSAR